MPFDSDAIDRHGRHGRTRLAGYPGGRYPVQRFAIERADGRIYLTADGAILDRFGEHELHRAIDAFHAVYPGLLIPDLVERTKVRLPMIATDSERHRRGAGLAARSPPDH